MAAKEAAQLQREVAAKAAQREVKLNALWRGKSYDALLSAFGEPKVMMNILGYRPLKTSLVLYDVVDEKLSCVDTFTMVKDESSGKWSVADYYCR